MEAVFAVSSIGLLRELGIAGVAMTVANGSGVVVYYI